jgi:hypothetical protein
VIEKIIKYYEILTRNGKSHTRKQIKVRAEKTAERLDLCRNGIPHTPSPLFEIQPFRINYRKTYTMEFIQKYFTELADHLRSVGRRVRIRVYSPGFHALGGQPWAIEMMNDGNGRFVDIRIESSGIKDHTFQAIDVDTEGRKLVLGVRVRGKLVKTYFFGRNNGGGPVSIPGFTRIIDYESAPKIASSGKNPDNTFRGGLVEKVMGSFNEIGLHCHEGIRFGVANDDSVWVNFSRISGILDVNQSKRQILLKGFGDANYLCGMDERRPFVALVPVEANSIKDAHTKLLPGNLEPGNEYKRQGEWFFIPKKVPGNFYKRPVIKGYELKRMKRSKPHTAEMGVKVGKQIFVRGWVEHEDHNALLLNNWHLVWLNNEIVEKYAYNID